MKNNFKYSLLGLLTLALTSCGIPTATELNVMSFNIRLDVASDSLNSWQYRKTHVGEMLRYYAPDVVGMQEVLKSQLDDLKAELPTYTAIGVGRDDGIEKGEYCSIFFKTDRFKLVKQGTYSLSETPEKIGKPGWDAAYPRIVTWVILQEKVCGKKFAFFNTHFDHMGQVARRESAHLLIAKMRELSKGLPTVITGDFNSTPCSEPITIITETEGIQDARKAASITYGPKWSFHDFGRDPVDKRERIDYIFLKGNIKVSRYRVIDDVTATGFLSDHSPVQAGLTIY